MSITEEDMEKYTSLEYKISVEADKILKQIDAIEPIDGLKHLSISSIDDDTIEFTGDEYWAYGGHESYEYSIPSVILYCKEGRKAFFDGLHQKVEAKKEAELLKQNEKAAKQEQQDVEQYEKLKLKFGEAK